MGWSTMGMMSTNASSTGSYSTDRYNFDLISSSIRDDDLKIFVPYSNYSVTTNRLLFHIKALKENTSVKKIDLSGSGSLFGNREVTDEVITAIADLILVNPNITEIDLSRTYTTNKGATNLLNAMQKNTTLLQVNLYQQSGPIDPAIIKEIDTLLKRNKELKIKQPCPSESKDQLELKLRICQRKKAWQKKLLDDNINSYKESLHIFKHGGPGYYEYAYYNSEAFRSHYKKFMTECEAEKMLQSKLNNINKTYNSGPLNVGTLFNPFSCSTDHPTAIVSQQPGDDKSVDAKSVAAQQAKKK